MKDTAESPYHVLPAEVVQDQLHLRVQQLHAAVGRRAVRRVDLADALPKK